MAKPVLDLGHLLLPAGAAPVTPGCSSRTSSPGPIPTSLLYSRKGATEKVPFCLPQALPSPPGKLLLLLVHTEVPPIFPEKLGLRLGCACVPVSVLMQATGTPF